MTDTTVHDREREDLVGALRELRDGIEPLVAELLCGTQLSVASADRWLVFIDAISDVIVLCRRYVLPVEHSRYES